MVSLSSILLYNSVSVSAGEDPDIKMSVKSDKMIYGSRLKETIFTFSQGKFAVSGTLSSLKEAGEDFSLFKLGQLEQKHTTVDLWSVFQQVERIVGF